MQPPPLIEDEVTRLEVLRELGVLDSDPDDWLDRITSYCRSRFRVPICLVSLVDANRQWFLSSSGLDVKQTPRSVSFCGHAVANDRMLVVPDAGLDPRFYDNPLVTAGPLIRFYAGSPIRIGGQPVGTLCIIDQRVRGLLPEDASELTDIADSVAWYLGYRKSRAAHKCATVPGEVVCLEGTPNPPVGPVRDEQDPWIAAVDYIRRNPITVEARMLRRISLGSPGAGLARVVRAWEEETLDPRAVSIAMRLLSIRAEAAA